MSKEIMQKLGIESCHYFFYFHPMGKHTKDSTKDAAGKPVIKDKTKPTGTILATWAILPNWTSFCLRLEVNDLYIK